ncbi:unnamed protein product [Paramecium pentaurelia]|uniref:Glutathione S-transferase n=1 Tax=Paramecium pentaurelia TaxID=43138 RepID=A0A8S1X9P4_9CILI|nr:unnamed protein product [Paramecium pentaurelia]
MSLTLVSYNISPFVLRVTSALNYFQIPYQQKDVDVMNKPEWFIKANPLEKIPTLFVGDKVIQESLVILEYINSLVPNSLLPNDPLEKAINRSRAEFSNDVIGVILGLTAASTEEAFNNGLTELKWYFDKLENWLKQTKFIYSDELTLADFAYVPIYAILQALSPHLKFNIFEGFPKVQQYGTTLLGLPRVGTSKPEGYEQILLERIKTRKPYFLSV